MKPTLVNPLREVCNYVMEKGVMQSSWSSANLVAIPKPGKDLEDLASYRPIALLNQDGKIFISISA